MRQLGDFWMRSLLAVLLFLLSPSCTFSFAEDEYLYHYVRSGETLSGIASRYRVSMRDLLEANPGVSTRKILRIGQELRVPNVIGIPQKNEASTIHSPPSLTSILMDPEVSAAPMASMLQREPRFEETTYTLYPGDKLAYISHVFRVSMDALIERNPILKESKVVENLTLIVPANYDFSQKLTEGVVSSLSNLDLFRYSLLTKEERHLMGALEPSAASKIQTNKLVSLQETTLIQTMGNSPTLSFSPPTFGYVTSKFGKRWMGYHHGIDIAAPLGSPIYAAKGGKVIYAGWAFRYGKLIRIEHSNGISTYYGHCSKLLVKKGDWVAEGQKIAEVGNTGRSSGPHLHFEIRLDGKAVNPAIYVGEKIRPEFAMAEQPKAEETDHRTFLIE